jgi:hypothetical protein
MRERINIAGWSPYRRSGGVTGHILAMSEMAAEYFGLKVDVRADHFGARPMESYMWRFRGVRPLSDSEDFYSGPDYPDYCGQVAKYESSYWKKVKCRTEAYALATNLNLLKPVTVSEESAFEGGAGEVCFVDSSGKNSPYSFKVLNEADIILVFLPVSSIQIRKFFYLYSYYISKSFFVINRFSQYDNFLLELLKEYKVPKKRVAVIPYSPQLDRACRDKTMDSLIADEMGSGKRTEYFNRIKHITKQVLIEGGKLAEMKRSTEDKNTEKTALK